MDARHQSGAGWFIRRTPDRHAGMTPMEEPERDEVLFRPHPSGAKLIRMASVPKQAGQESRSGTVETDRSSTSPQKRVVASQRSGQTHRWTGHVTAIAVNFVLLYIVRNLGDWSLLPFLTDDYDLVVGALSLGIVATITGRFLQIVFPGRRMAILIDGVVTAVGFLVLVRVLRIFPFGFEPDGFRWDVLARFVLIVGLIGSGLTVLVTPLRLLRPDGIR